TFNLSDSPKRSSPACSSRARAYSIRARNRSSLAAKRRGRVVIVVCVYPHGSSLKPVCYAMRLGNIARPNSRRQTVGILVRFTNGFFHIVEHDRRKHRTKNLFARNGHVILHVVENSRLHKIAFTIAELRAGASGDEFCSLSFSLFYVAEDFLHLRLAD